VPDGVEADPGAAFGRGGAVGGHGALLLLGWSGR
jgi:hypothetical protein